jgi:hypothetical protein
MSGDKLNGRRTVLLATCAALPGGDEDAELLGAALAARGIEARWQVWTDPAARWDGQLTVLRSTWDYTDAYDDFLAWTRGVERLLNPAPLIAWNTDKTYLGALSAAGVPCVPTCFAAPGEPVVLPEAGEFVVKPAVGAGSRGAGRFGSGQQAAALKHVAALHGAGFTVMVQPYLAAVDETGETALIYLDGEFSHAISKGAMLPRNVVHPASSYALYVEERIEPRLASEAELAAGAKAMAVLRERLGSEPLYARVDLLPTEAGPVLGELELAEPSLFLEHGVGAADRFAAAIAARL